MRWHYLIAAATPAVATAQQAAPPPAAPPAAPTQAAAQDQNVSDEPDIIVQGQRNLPGAVIGDIPPEEQLGPADIRSYGVNSVAELLSELSPQTRSGRGSGGQPVVLLNGRRISSFAEIRDLPTEAIARVDILPEEVALKYGYAADQRVVNFVLRQRFRAITSELSDRITTRGDRNQPQAELDLLNIRRDRRVNLHSSYQESAALLESDRDVQSTAASGVDQSPYRTLLGFSRQMSVNGSYARNIGKVGATLNARLEGDQGHGLQGLPLAVIAAPGQATVTRGIGLYGPLDQRTTTLNGHLGATLNGDIGRWRWNVTGNYDDVTAKTRTEAGVDATGFIRRLATGDPTADPLGTFTTADFPLLPDNYARSRSRSGGVNAQANGTLFRLPAGDVSSTIAIGGDTGDFGSRSIRAGLLQTGRVSRDTGSGRLNLDLPVTSRGTGFGDAIGNLSVNLNAAAEQVSDFGTLTTFGYGANWSPVEPIRIIASVTDQKDAPSAQQLGNPQVVTPNVRLFDYVNGTTAIVTTVSGGNPGLNRFQTHTTKLGLTLKPWAAKDLTFIANYVTARVDDPVASFPAATAQIAAAFPGRFTRDAAGNLLRVDTRPVNFARTDRSELRYGFNLSIPLKSELQRKIEAFRNGTGPNPFEGLSFPGQRRPGQGQGQSGAAPTGARPPDGGAAQGGFRGFGGQGGQGGPGGPGGGGVRGGGGGFGGRGGQGGGRLQFALYHTWHFTDSVLVANGGPRLDLLNGDAIGAAGGQSRHELEGQAGYSNNGLGARASVNFRSATRVDGGTAAAPTSLSFGSLTTASLRLFFDPTQRLDLLRKHPWVRGTRLTLGIDNLFDARQRVTDQTGAVPLNYQPDLLDPLGRTVRLSIRKLFF